MTTFLIPNTDKIYDDMTTKFIKKKDRDLIRPFFHPSTFSDGNQNAAVHQ